MIIAEYKCGYCGSSFKLSYFNSVDIPERNVGCTNCRVAGADVKLIKKIRDERRPEMVGAICDDFKAAVKKKGKKTSSLDYPISVLTEERDSIHGLPLRKADQLQKAINILIGKKYKIVKKEFKKEVEKKETGVVDKHLFKK